MRKPNQLIMKQTYDYHTKEWEAFYQEAVEQGDVNPDEQDAMDLAEVYYSDYEEGTYGLDDPETSIYFSAGVYCLEIE